MTPVQFESRLRDKLAVFDKNGAIEVSRDIMDYLYLSRQPFPKKTAGGILQLLRSHRMFELMKQVTDAFIFSGNGSFNVYRQYAQALIDTEYFSAALFILDQLIRDSRTTPVDNTDGQIEYMEAQGLKGRLYKQLYANNANRDVHNTSLLQQAIESYYEIYRESPTQIWQGINVVALLKRAEKDGIEFNQYPDYKLIAGQIMSVVEEKEKNNDPGKRTEVWDWATAAEACLALDRLEEAEKWIAFYASDPSTDAFQLAGTIRQLEEIWNLNIQDKDNRILHVLRAELMKREGGTLVVEASELNVMQQLPNHKEYEKSFGDNVFIDFKSYKKGYACCELVGRIGRNELKGDGTGFLLNGSHLHPSLSNEVVLITNGHVISEDPKIRMDYGALNPAEAIIMFEALNREEKFRVGSVFWYSPPAELDIAIIRFKTDDIERLKNLTKNAVPYELSSVLPLASGNPLTDPRLYVIGHPKGGPLQFSMQDNLLLDCEDPRIHYRTPTQGGSSGSPVFNQQWELLGVHHKGSDQMKKLNGKDGVYQANEGMYIQTIISQIKNSVS